MITKDVELHVTGKSVFTDDVPLPPETLICAVLFSKIAAGRIRHLSAEAAAGMPGVKAVVTAKDLEGENQIGTIILDEELLASSEIHFYGQPIAAVYAENEKQARDAVKKIILETDAEKPVIDPRQAYALGRVLAPPRTFQLGNPDGALEGCAYVFSGSAESGGQEHFYMEGQAAVAFPGEGNSFRVLSSTQAPTTVQKVTARVLGVSMNQVEVDVRRIGGGFGGKEDQANAWAALAAVGVQKTGRPVKLVLRRSEDLRVTGKRHPYSSDFTIGLDSDGKILAYKVFLYQNSGAAADLSTAILERSLFHAAGSYFIPNVRATAVCCRTNLTPFTAFRGFGGPQAMFVMECALFEASRGTGIPVEKLQEINLLKEGDEFPYGMKAAACNARRCRAELENRFRTDELIAEISVFNGRSGRHQKGYAFMPVCFGISFTNIILNQARSLVHVYLDGSVGVSTGAVEMGQGVNQKIVDIVARTLSLPDKKIRIESTNTTRVADTSPTAASTGSDLNGRAAQIACEQILEGLRAAFAGTEEGRRFADGTLSWEEAVSLAYAKRINLSAEAHYATPEIYFDRKTEKGKPFAYHVYGSAFLEVTVDCLLGTYAIDRVCIVHDSGSSINRTVDLGQVEGGLAQGLGWMTLEELEYTDDGFLLNGTAGTYKIPDMFFSPEQLSVAFLENAPNPHAVLNSKAVGEPPFMYGIGVYFALLKAALGAAPGKKLSYRAPMTTERLFNILTGRKEAHG